MIGRAECEGVPRDLGHDQGRALAQEIRRAAGTGSGGRLARALAALRPARGAARDLERYFPHLAERAAGMAEAAGVERRGLLARCVPPAWDALPSTHSGVGIALRAEPGGAGACLAASLPLPRDGEAMLRRSHPQGGLASVELGLAWWVGAFAGVNAAGLAGLVVPGPAASATGNGPRPPQARGAPAALFVTQCLERFERVGPALEWCVRRPAAGPAVLLFADAHGDLGGVAVQAADRRVLRDHEGLLVVGAPEQRRARVEKDARLAAGCLAAARLDGLLAAASPDAQPEIALCLLPATRRLGLLGADGGADGPAWQAP